MDIFGGDAQDPSKTLITTLNGVIRDMEGDLPVLRLRYTEMISDLAMELMGKIIKSVEITQIPAVMEECQVLRKKIQIAMEENEEEWRYSIHEARRELQVWYGLQNFNKKHNKVVKYRFFTKWKAITESAVRKKHSEEDKYFYSTKTLLLMKRWDNNIKRDTLDKWAAYARRRAEKKEHLRVVLGKAARHDTLESDLAEADETMYSLVVRSYAKLRKAQVFRVWKDEVAGAKLEKTKGIMVRSYTVKAEEAHVTAQKLQEALGTIRDLKEEKRRMKAFASEMERDLEEKESMLESLGIKGGAAAAGTLGDRVAAATASRGSSGGEVPPADGEELETPAARVGVAEGEGEGEGAEAEAEAAAAPAAAAAVVGVVGGEDAPKRRRRRRGSVTGSREAFSREGLSRAASSAGSSREALSREGSGATAIKDHLRRVQGGAPRMRETTRGAAGRDEATSPSPRGWGGGGESVSPGAIPKPAEGSAADEKRDDEADELVRMLEAADRGAKARAGEQLGHVATIGTQTQPEEGHTPALSSADPLSGRLMRQTSLNERVRERRSSLPMSSNASPLGGWVPGGGGGSRHHNALGKSPELRSRSPPPGARSPPQKQLSSPAERRSSSPVSPPPPVAAEAATRGEGKTGQGGDPRDAAAAVRAKAGEERRAAAAKQAVADAEAREKRQAAAVAEANRKAFEAERETEKWRKKAMDAEERGLKHARDEYERREGDVARRATEKLEGIYSEQTAKLEGMYKTQVQSLRLQLEEARESERRLWEVVQVGGLEGVAVADGLEGAELQREPDGALLREHYHQGNLREGLAPPDVLEGAHHVPYTQGGVVEERQHGPQGAGGVGRAGEVRPRRGHSGSPPRGRAGSPPREARLRALAPSPLVDVGAEAGVGVGAGDPRATAKGAAGPRGPAQGGNAQGGYAYYGEGGNVRYPVEVRDTDFWRIQGGSQLRGAGARPGTVPAMPLAGRDREREGRATKSRQGPRVAARGPGRPLAERGPWENGWDTTPSSLNWGPMAGGAGGGGDGLDGGISLPALHAPGGYGWEDEGIVEAMAAVYAAEAKRSRTPGPGGMAAFYPDPTPQHPLSYSAFPARLPGGKEPPPRPRAGSPAVHVRAERGAAGPERTAGGFDSWGGRRGKFPAERADGHAWTDSEAAIRLEGA